MPSDAPLADAVDAFLADPGTTFTVPGHKRAIGIGHVIVPYVLITVALGALVTRLPIASWWMIPPAFLAHHLTYYFGIVWGMLRGVWRR